MPSWAHPILAAPVLVAVHVLVYNVAQVSASPGINEAAECTELPACKGFADQLPAQTQYGYLTCDSQYRQVDESAPAGVTVKMVCPVSCGFCPEDLSDLSDEERCLKSTHCFPRFEVCMDGYGGVPDFFHSTP